MSAADTLRRARARIEDPSSWIAGTFATDEEGEECHPRQSKACHWCALGAVVAETGDMKGMFEMCRDLLRAAVPGGDATVADYNDDPSVEHADILALFDRAIELAAAKGDEVSS